MTITAKAALVLAIGLCASACGGSASLPTTPRPWRCFRTSSKDSAW